MQVKRESCGAGDIVRRQGFNFQVDARRDARVTTPFRIGRYLAPPIQGQSQCVKWRRLIHAGADDHRSETKPRRRSRRPGASRIDAHGSRIARTWRRRLNSPGKSAGRASNGAEEKGGHTASSRRLGGETVDAPTQSTAFHWSQRGREDLALPEIASTSNWYLGHGSIASSLTGHRSLPPLPG